MGEFISLCLISLFVILSLIAEQGTDGTRRVIQWIINILFFALMLPFVYYMNEFVEAFQRLP